MRACAGRGVKRGYRTVVGVAQGSVPCQRPMSADPDERIASSHETRRAGRSVPIASVLNGAVDYDGVASRAGNERNG